MLDALDKRVNIKDLALESPTKQAQVLFDPEREITRDDWSNMVNYLDRLRNERAWMVFGEMAASMKLLLPDKFATVKLTNDDWEVMKKICDNERKAFLEDGQLDTNESTPVAFYSKILFPEKFPQVDFLDEILAGTVEQVKKDAQELFIDPEMEEYLDWAALGYSYVKFIKPKFYSLDFSPEGEGEAIMNGLKAHDDVSIRTLASLRIADFERFKNFKLTPNQWKKEYDVLGQIRQGYSPSLHPLADFAVQARDLEIMAAEDIKVTDSGINIILPRTSRSLISKSPTLPQRRNF